MDMIKEIRIEEGKLKVVFEIRDNGVVELKQFDRLVGSMQKKKSVRRKIFIRLRRFRSREKEAAECMHINIM